MTLEIEATAARMYGLGGAVALVTGGGGGIGSAICETLAALGASVRVADIDLDAAQQVAARITDAGGSASARALVDVTDAE